MEKHAVFCDECGLEIEGCPIEVTGRYVELNRTYHFHNFNCLATWAAHRASMVPIRRAEPGAGSQERDRRSTDGDHEDAAKAPSIGAR
jgi:hypothetical protein